MRFFLFLISLSIIFFNGCSSDSDEIKSENNPQKVVKLALAGNVAYAIPKLITKFQEQNPNIKIEFVLGSSGKLTAQIRNHAPFDIFMSANMKYPKELYKNKLTVTNPVIYAKGGIALLSKNSRDFSDISELLKNINIKKIALANPKTAPYGKASIETLKNLKIYDEVQSKLIFAETVTQSVQYILTATDIGFVAKSSLYDSKLSQYRENQNWISIDEKLFTPIEQGIVILQNAQKHDNLEATQKFYDFILSSDAKKIFQEFGYIIN
jgi:molybdate transport system substrate-binding protein